MWNYSYVLPNFMVLVTFTIYFFARPRIVIRRNRVFLELIASDFLVVVFDVISSRADELYTDFSDGALYVLNLLYFVLFLIRAFLFFAFTLCLLTINTDSIPRKLLVSGLFLVSEIVTLSSPVTHAVFSIGLDGYQKGPCYNILYICFVGYLLAAIVLLIRYRRRLNRSEFIFAVGYNVALLLGNIIRFVFPKVLVMNIFSLIAIIMIYLSFENPDFYQEGRTGTFNRRAMREMLREITGQRIYHILGFVLKNYPELREISGSAQTDKGISLIGEYLTHEFPETRAFYLRNGRFALLCAENTDLDSIQEKIAKRFKSLWKTQDAELIFEAGFVQIHPGSDTRDVEVVTNGLFEALRRVEENENESVNLDTEGLHSIDHKTDIKRALESALENNRVEIYLQPLFDSHTYRIVGAEALSRIFDAEGKMLPPGLFIPIAEKNGRINVLGEQVFRKVCAFVKDYGLEPLGLRWINVNLSPLQCLRVDLHDRFVNILKEYGVDAKYIHLEITEESMIDFQLLQKQIETMQESGFSFVLDDYGSGYSNVTRLKHCPFVNVKLDMTVVWDYMKEPDAILPGLVKAFKEMNFGVTAEGIESAEMAEAMRDIGCDYLQGYFFSKPLPVEEFVQKYKNGTGE